MDGDGDGMGPNATTWRVSEIRIREKMMGSRFWCGDGHLLICVVRWYWVCVGMEMWQKPLRSMRCCMRINIYRTQSRNMHDL